MKINNIPYVYMLLAVTSISFSSFFAKLCLMYGQNIFVTVLMRFVVPCIIMIIIFTFFKSFRNLSTVYIKFHIFRGLCLTASQFLLFTSMTHLPMAEATVLYNTGPIFLVIFSLFFNYKISTNNLIGLLLGTIGVTLICHPQNGIFNIYTIFGILSGLAFSFSQLTFFKSAHTEDNLNIMFFLYLFTTIFSLILFAFSKEKIIFPHHLDLAHTYISILFLVLLGLASMSNQYFRGKAYANIENPNKLAPMIYLSILISGLLDWAFFGSIPDIQAIIGGISIIAGSYIASSRKKLNSKLKEPIFINNLKVSKYA